MNLILTIILFILISLCITVGVKLGINKLTGGKYSNIDVTDVITDLKPGWSPGFWGKIKLGQYTIPKTGKVPAIFNDGTDVYAGYYDIDTPKFIVVKQTGLIQAVAGDIKVIEVSDAIDSGNMISLILPKNGEYETTTVYDDAYISKVNDTDVVLCNGDDATIYGAYSTPETPAANGATVTGECNVSTDGTALTPFAPADINYLN